ncbi:MAG: hypothetical protein ACK5O7_01960 [Holosporales bacterium]
MARLWVMVLALTGSWALPSSTLEASHSVVAVEEIDEAPSCRLPRPQNIKKLQSRGERDGHGSLRVDSRPSSKTKPASKTSISPTLSQEPFVQEQAALIDEQPRQPNFLVRLVQKIGDEPSQVHFFDQFGRSGTHVLPFGS